MTTAHVTTRDALRLAADIYLPADAPLAAVVIAHGFAASRRERGVREQALALRARGFAVVVPDGRGHGQSPGICTLGSDEALDVAAGVEHARQLSDDVVVVGASMGAISALRYAAEDPGLAGVVAVSGPASWTLPRTPIGMLNVALTQTRPGRAVLKRRMGVSVAPGFTYAEPPVELVGRLASPLAIVHGTRDRIIPARAAHQLYAAATGPRVLHLVPGMGHAFEEIGRATVTAAAAWTLEQLTEPDAA